MEPINTNARIAPATMRVWAGEFVALIAAADAALSARRHAEGAVREAETALASATAARGASDAAVDQAEANLALSDRSRPFVKAADDARAAAAGAPLAEDRARRTLEALRTRLAEFDPPIAAAEAALHAKRDQVASLMLAQFADEWREAVAMLADIAARAFALAAAAGESRASRQIKYVVICDLVEIPDLFRDGRAEIAGLGRQGSLAQDWRHFPGAAALGDALAPLTDALQSLAADANRISREKAAVERAARPPKAPQPNGATVTVHHAGDTFVHDATLAGYAGAIGAQVPAGPSEAELRARFAAVKAMRHPMTLYAPAHLSAARAEEELFEDFAFAYRRILSLYRVDELDRKRDTISWCDEAEEWGKLMGLGMRRITVPAYVAAVLAQGDIKNYLGGGRWDTFFGLSTKAGRPAAVPPLEDLRRGSSELAPAELAQV